MKVDSLAQAKDFAYRLLSYRERSIKEIGEKLVQKGFEKEICNKAIENLKAHKLLDDYRFAKAFVESRIKYRPSGLALIRALLFSKGISKDIIESILSDVGRDYDEYKVSYEIANSKAKKLYKVGRLKAKRRIYGYLLRRRFKKEVIYHVLNSIFDTEEAPKLFGD